MLHQKDLMEKLRNDDIPEVLPNKPPEQEASSCCALGFWSRGPGFKFRWRSVHDCTALYCTEPFISILPCLDMTFNNVEMDVEHQIINLFNPCPAE